MGSTTPSSHRSFCILGRPYAAQISQISLDFAKSPLIPKDIVFSLDACRSILEWCYRRLAMSLLADPRTHDGCQRRLADHEKSYPCNPAGVLHGDPSPCASARLVRQRYLLGSSDDRFQNHPSIPIPPTNPTQSFWKEKTHSSHALAGPIPCTRPKSTAARFTSSSASSSGIFPCVSRLPMARQETAFCDAVRSVGVSVIWIAERVKGSGREGKERNVPRL